MAEADVIVKGDLFKRLVKGLSILVNEAVFKFDSDGLKVAVADSANVAMVIATLPYNVCEAYTSEGISVGVDVDRVENILKLIGKKDNLEILVDGNDLHLKFRCFDYSIMTIDPESIRSPKVPELELPALAVVNADEFKKAIQSADKIADHATFVSDENGFFVEAKGDVDGIRVEFETIEHNKENARATYSLSYLKEFTKVLGNKDIVKVKFGNDYPVWLIFDIEDGLKIEYILAPRVEYEY